MPTSFHAVHFLFSLEHCTSAVKASVAKRFTTSRLSANGSMQIEMILTFTTSCSEATFAKTVFVVNSLGVSTTGWSLEIMNTYHLHNFECIPIISSGTNSDVVKWGENVGGHTSFGGV